MITNMKYRKRNIVKENTNYDGILQSFLNQEDKIFIPDEQSTTDRYNWHSLAEKHNLVHVTIMLRREVVICETHHRPIIGPRQRTCCEEQLCDMCYQCEYVCHDCDPNDCDCCQRGTSQNQKVRTIVLFKEEEFKNIDSKEHIETNVRKYLISKGLV